MGLLQSIAQSFKTNKPKIVMFGLDAAGKSTIAYKMVKSNVDTLLPTIGVYIEHFDDQNFQIHSWDIGGRDKMWLIYQHYVRECKGLVFVIDGSQNQIERIQQAKQNLKKILSRDESEGKPLLILINKIDLKPGMNNQYFSQKYALDDIPGHAMHIQQCCAFNGDGLKQGFAWLKDTLNNRS